LTSVRSNRQTKTSDWLATAIVTLWTLQGDHNEILQRALP
jgi:hypothetical protein